MSVKLDYYKIFSVVAEQQSLSGAAEKLYMTQPAVSQTIKQLESEIGTRLFTRNAKGVKLTNEGEVLYEHIYRAMNMIKIGEEKVKQSIDLLSGELRIGVGDAICRHLLLGHLEHFHKEYPNINLKIINRTTTEQCELLKAGDIDLALCNLPIKEKSFEVRDYFPIHDIFVGGERYKEMSKKPITLEVLRTLPLIFLEKKSNSRQYIDKYMQTQGVKLDTEIELGSHDLLLEFAKINLGVACVIKEFSKEYLQEKGLYEICLSEPIPRRSIGCCFLKSVTLSPVAKQFIDSLEKNLKKY